MRSFLWKCTQNSINIKNHSTGTQTNSFELFLQGFHLKQYKHCSGQLLWKTILKLMSQRLQLFNLTIKIIFEKVAQKQTKKALLESILDHCSFWVLCRVAIWAPILTYACMSVETLRFYAMYCLLASMWLCYRSPLLYFVEVYRLLCIILLNLHFESQICILMQLFITCLRCFNMHSENFASLIGLQLSCIIKTVIKGFKQYSQCEGECNDYLAIWIFQRI